MLGIFITNPTQLIGILTFVAASIACFLSVRSPGLQDARVWKLLAFINLLFTTEVVVGFRLRVHSLVVSLLINHGQYNNRASIQETLILLSVFSFLISIVTIFIWFRPVGGQQSPPRVLLSQSVPYLQSKRFLSTTWTLSFIDRSLGDDRGMDLVGCGVRRGTISHPSKNWLLDLTIRIAFRSPATSF